MKHTLRVAAISAATLLFLAGCGGTDGATETASSTDFNQADVTFATGMIQHHAQALSMVDLTLGRPLEPAVERLAEAIRDAQAPEIETMSDWLTDWGKPVPQTMRDHVNAHTDGEISAEMGGDLPGMMTSADMTSLEDTGDSKFQDLWLQMMIEHHEGAVEMAEAEESDGRQPAAIDLAQNIQSTQNAEITTMHELLGS